MIAGTGSQNAKIQRTKGRRSRRPAAPVAAMVAMVSFAVIELSWATCTESGFSEHVGAKAGVGETEHEIETDPLKPPTDVTVTVAFAD